MELKSINELEAATQKGRFELFRIGTALLFIVGIMLYIEMLQQPGEGSLLLVIAAMIGGYMAMNIGANDVANNVGPAVGSQALTLTGAIIIAVIFEGSGALIAGGDVVSTIKKGIIDPAQITDTNTFIWLMMAALLAGAIWLNIATAMGAPVSTTHSIVGGVLGAGIAAGGMGIANWGKMGAIASSWVISPVLGGIIAAAFLYLIKRTITYQHDMIKSAKRVVPLLIMLMAWSFTTYLMLKGIKKIWKIDFFTAVSLSAVISVAIYLLVRPMISKAATFLPNEKSSINQLFTVPLIFAAALLSFAHGANDVANAVGPLAAINEAITVGGVTTKASIPLWVARYSWLELTVAKFRCTKPSWRAASITVIIASQMGLPVSSTHIAVGGIFGVGFLREYLKTSYGTMIEEIKHHHESEDPEVIESFLLEFKKAHLQKKSDMLQQLKNNSAKAHLTKKERKRLSKIYKKALVKRSHLIRIAAAWVITVPVSGILAALLFYMIRGMMLPD